MVLGFICLFVFNLNQIDFDHFLQGQLRKKLGYINGKSLLTQYKTSPISLLASPLWQV